MIISRLNITGEINNVTPKVVIEEIADSCGIKYDPNNYSIIYRNKLIEKIHKVQIKLNENFKKDNESLRLIARFVNSKYKRWKKEDLLLAFDFLLSFEKEENIINYLETNFSSLHLENLQNTNESKSIYGLQTSENIYSLNACVLFRLCKYFSIITNYHSSMEQMFNNLRLFLIIEKSYLIENDIKTKIYDELRFSANPNDLVNISNMLNIIPDLKDKTKNKKEVRKNYTYEEYEHCANIILSDDTRRNPKNNLEAIVMASIYEKINLSMCDDPLSEYFLLIKNPYFPHDKNLIKCLRRARTYPEDLQNPHLNKIFNPNLPENMYSNRDLITLCSEEGIQTDGDFYTLLQMAYLTETFVHGKQIGITNDLNTFNEEFKNLEYDQVVVFGIRNEKRLRAYTYGELTDTFSNYKRFSDPITNQLFTEEAINKLYLLTQKDKREKESEEVYRERLELGEEIERIKIYISSNNEYVEEFINKYENLDDDDKKKVENCLYILLHTAMYMRNWDGISDYPLSSESTNFVREKQIIVDDRVTQSLIDFDLSLKELKNLGEFIEKLPLMQYHKESNSFVTSNDESEGITIKERIRIVREGEAAGLNSCIRLTSNKFCATAYYYMILLGFRLPFSINEVSQIF